MSDWDQYYTGPEFRLNGRILEAREVTLHDCERDAEIARLRSDRALFEHQRDLAVDKFEKLRTAFRANMIRRAKPGEDIDAEIERVLRDI